MTHQVPLYEAFARRPAVMTVDGLHIRPLYDLLDGYELEIGSWVSGAVAGRQSAYGMAAECSEALPDPPIDSSGRLKPRTRKVLGHFAREAAEEFGEAGFCNMPEMWVAWLMEEHGVLCEVLAAAQERRGT